MGTGGIPGSILAGVFDSARREWSYLLNNINPRIHQVVRG